MYTLETGALCAENSAKRAAQSARNGNALEYRRHMLDALESIQLALKAELTGDVLLAPNKTNTEESHDHEQC